MRRARARDGTVALAVAAAIHVALAAALATTSLDDLDRGAQLVELDVRQTPPPPPPPPVSPTPTPIPTPEPEPPHPRKAQPARSPSTFQPPPNRESPPEPTPAAAPPVFGITLESTDTEGPGITAPVGNTLLTKPIARPQTESAPAPYAGGAPGSLEPVPEAYVAQPPRLLKEVKGADVYPPDAQRLELEGVVKARLVIDDKGDVRSVRIIGRAGHGFDEAASRALRQFKFTPAKTRDGRSVTVNLNWNFRFEIPR